MCIISEHIMIIRAAKKRIAELEQKLSDEQKAAGYWMKQSRKDHNRAEKLEQQLSRYQGGVEVDGEMFGAQGIRLYSPINDDHAKTSRKRVRVLVMPVQEKL